MTIEQPKLLWTSRLDNTFSLGTMDYVPSGVPTVPYYNRSDFSGTDSMGNGKTSLQTALQSTVLWQAYKTIVDPTDVSSPPVLTDFTDVIDFTIAANDAPGGKGNKLIMTQKKRSATKWTGFRPQAASVTTRTQNVPLNSLYVRKKIKIPSNMVDVLSGSATVGWCELDAIKCSPDFGTTVDLRYNVQAQKLQGESGLRFVSQIDRGTGSTNVITPGTSTEGFCNPGDWFLMEYYIRRPATGGYNNTTDGLFQVVMTNLNTLAREVILDQRGGIAFGLSNGQLSLFYQYLQYTGGFPSVGTFVLEVAEVEYWDMPPNALILSSNTALDALL